MFAIFEFGGKQYKATKGTTLKLEKIQEKNKETFFDKVLLVSDENNETIVGSPYVKGYAVHAKIIDTVKDKKVLIFKKKRRHNYRRKIADFYDYELSDLNNVKLTRTDPGSSRHLYVIRVSERDKLARYLLKNKIPIQFHYPYSLNKSRALSKHKKVKLIKFY